jgi:hypothetical protein
LAGNRALKILFNGNRFKGHHAASFLISIEKTGR